jgi:methyl-accepting chemotaxis protein
MSESRSSLKRRFIFFISGMIVLLSVILGIVFFFNSQSLLNEELDRRGTLITRQLGHGADVGIVNNSLTYLDQKIANFTDDPDVSFIIFRNSSGLILRDWFRQSDMRDEVSRDPHAEQYRYRGYEIRHISRPVTSVTRMLSDDFMAVFGEGAGLASDEVEIETVGLVEVGISTENVHLRLRSILTKGGMVVLTGILVAILLSYFYIGHATRPLNRMVSAARSVAEGDLAVTIDIDSADEIGELAGSFNFMLENLRELFSRIQGASISLSEVGVRVSGASREVLDGAKTQSTSIEDMSLFIREMNLAVKETKNMTDALSVTAVESSTSIVEMSATINQVDASMETLNESVRETKLSIDEIAASIREVSSNVARLSEAATETATSMTEIDSSIKQVETNSRETTALSDKVKQDAERGRESVQKTIDGIYKIRESSLAIDKVIGSLDEKTNRIGSILNVIDEIADQTNLLALNAAITAAQAGEQGRAFTVVAEEIKELAERTTKSTAEISDLITAVQDESGNAVRAMELGNRNIEAGVKLANNAGTALEEIYNSSERSSSMIVAISRATNEQAKGSNQVTMAINEISKMAERIRQAMEDQKARSQQIGDAAERMKQIAEQVKRTTREQSQGSKFINTAIESINANVGSISRNSDEQTRGSDRVVRSVDTIREITDRNHQNVANLEGVTEVLNRQTEILMELVRRFKL